MGYKRQHRRLKIIDHMYNPTHVPKKICASTEGPGIILPRTLRLHLHGTVFFWALTKKLKRYKPET